MSRTLVAAGLALTVLAAPVALVMTATTGVTAADVPATCAPDQLDDLADLDAEQTRNAGIITAVGQQAGVPQYGLQIALATAMQESQLHNLPYGDRDSLGLFQQRPSAGWGTAEQVMDPVYAAQAFFGGPTGPNNGQPAGLLDIDGWADMPLTVAAQAVQRSAFPDAYARWEDDAAAWLTDLLAVDGRPCLSGGGAQVCPPIGHPAEDGLTTDALRVLRCIAATFPQITTFHGVGDRPNESDHPIGRAVDAMIPDWATPAGNELGWRVAEWLQANHVCLGVTYVIWDAQIFSADRASEGWRPYQHPNGWADANSAHRNHLHISVAGDTRGHVDGAWVVPSSGTTSDYGTVRTGWRGTPASTWPHGVGCPVLRATGGQATYAGWDGAY